MTTDPPILDPRREAEILQAFFARAPGYVPEWIPKPGLPDAALAAIFARYAAILLEGLRQTPDRAFLAFLDSLGTRLLPAEAARVPLVFELMDNATTDPEIPADCQIASAAAPQSPSALLGGEAPVTRGEAAVFTIEKPITLARARLAVLFSLDPGIDACADHSSRLTTGFTLFADWRPTEHAIYLGHDELFALTGNPEVIPEVRLSVQLAVDRGASAPLNIDWESLTEAGWLPLELDQGDATSPGDDGTEGLTHDGQIRLRKTCGPDAREDTIAGRTSYWIRGVLRNLVPPAGSDISPFLPVVDSIRAQVSFVKSGLRPDAAANDGFSIDASTTFYPFGRQPALFSTFYLANDDVFARRRARVTLDIKIPGNISPEGSAALAWEYFDGKSWRSLESHEFHDGTEHLKKSGAIVFRCPTDWRATSVAGSTHHWVRARIDTGDYGHPVKVSVDNNHNVSAQDSTLKPPVIAVVSLEYSYQTDAETVDHCLAYNDFVFADHTRACTWPRSFFEPFRPLEERQPALHLGFDKALPQGLISLYLQVPDSGDEARIDPLPEFIWEFHGADGWAELGVLDETSGFRRSGMIQFIGPRDAIPMPGLGGDLVRVRARLKTGERLKSAPVAGIWMNAVWASHRLAVPREELGVSDGNPGQTFFVRSRATSESATVQGPNTPDRQPFFRESSPVLEGETLEVREWVGRGADYETAIQGIPPADLRFERDRISHAVTEVWVRWSGKTHLFHSGPHDRHYVIERARGSVRFGEDLHGRIPPAGARIVVSYGTGGGLSGNVPAGAITGLRTAVPCLKAVSNPVAALGGSAVETLAAVRSRGPHHLRHRDRALSVTDWEWLAREASPAVARARCLPVTGPVGRGQRGWVTLAILPHGNEAGPRPTAELRRRVRDYILARAPAALAGRIRVVTPAYVPVGVVVDVVPCSAAEASRVEARLLLRLHHFLHPLSGGPDGQGWEFGQVLHLSQIATLIETTEGVDHAIAIALRVGSEVWGDSVPVPADRLIAAGDHEVKLTLAIG